MSCGFPLLEYLLIHSNEQRIISISGNKQQLIMSGLYPDQNCLTFFIFSTFNNNIDIKFIVHDTFLE